MKTTHVGKSAIPPTPPTADLRASDCRTADGVEFSVTVPLVVGGTSKP